MVKSIQSNRAPPQFGDRKVKVLSNDEAKGYLHSSYTSSRINSFQLNSNEWIRSFTLIKDLLPFLPEKKKELLSSFFHNFPNIFSSTFAGQFSLHLPFNFFLHANTETISSYFLTKDLIKKPSKRIDDEQKLLNKIQLQLPMKGVLKKKRNGLVYLDISNHFTHALIPLLKEEGAVAPPFFHRFDGMGSHIPVILPEELKRMRFPKALPELGSTFHFSVTGFFSTTLHEFTGIDTLWFITIDSPALSDLRERHLLNKKIAGQEFYSIVAIKESKPNTKLEQEAFFYRINPSLHTI